MGRGNLFLLFCIFASMFLISGIYAQETDISTIDENAVLSETEGITPDSALYFFDEFLDRFGNDLNIREEKIAEIKAMIKDGKIDDAKIALQNYLEHAENLEREVSPEESEEARRSAAAIYNTLQEIKDEIPDDEKDNFDEILEREQSIVTASEIAGKIKELCEQLSKLDPLEYSRVCSTRDDYPDWRKKLDKDLTEEQRAEAEKFGAIMEECFKTSGQQCRCEEIPFKDFAEMCLIAAPLATACEVESDEDACEQLDNLEMPELPEHLQDVFDSLEGNIAEAQFENHMPRECRDAGATNPRECMKIMIRTHAPEECREALIEANVQNEREAREVCEKIMFELNAPEECIEAGLTDHEECGKLMFQLNAPEECIEAGLTGEHRSDSKKCQKIMEGLRGGKEGHGGFGGNCAGIQGSEERLKCYDSAAQGFSGDFKRGEEQNGPSGGWPEPCEKAGATTRESCEQIMREFSQSQFESREQSNEEFNQFQGEFTKPEEFTQPPATDEGTTASSETTTAIEPTTSGTATDSSGTSSTITGSIVFDNKFARYFFR